MAVHRTTGTLFVVATPIGNLEDLTFRALRVLGEVELIAAEDTRRTAKLLAHYKIRRPLVSLREHNEAREATRLVGLLQRGQSMALVSDAGTPAIADPADPSSAPRAREPVGPSGCRRSGPCRTPPATPRLRRAPSVSDAACR